MLDPTDVGVPVIELPESVRPAGSDLPDVTAQDTVPMDEDAVSVTEAALPRTTSLAVPDAVMPAVTLTLRYWYAVCVMPPVEVVALGITS